MSVLKVISFQVKQCVLFSFNFGEIMKLKHLIIIALMIGAILLTFLLIYQKQMSQYIFVGTMYANDCGEPFGGFEWCGEYDVRIENNIMILTFTAGLGDPLQKHRYNVKIVEFVEKQHVLILIENNIKWVEIKFKYYEKDPIWNKWNGYYIAHYVNATIFPGFAPHFYVEIRIRPI